MLRCALTMLPELDDDDSLDEMIKHIGSGRKRTADDLARRIGLDYKTRTELNITTIGSCDKNKAERKAINAQRYAADKRWRREQERMARAADPAAPPKDAAPKKKRRKRRKKATARRRGRPALGEPWKAEGVSKRTWFRHHPATERRGTKIARRRGTKFDRPAAAGSNGKPKQTQDDNSRNRDTKIDATKNGGPTSYLQVRRCMRREVPRAARPTHRQRPSGTERAAPRPGRPLPPRIYRRHHPRRRSGELTEGMLIRHPSLHRQRRRRDRICCTNAEPVVSSSSHHRRRSCG